MRIYLTPVRMDAPLTLERRGACLLINSEVFDFASLPLGCMLPAAAIESDWFTGPVLHDATGLRISLRLPHGPLPEGVTLSCYDFEVPHDGPIFLHAPHQEISS